MKLYKKFLFIGAISIFTLACRDKCKDVDCGKGYCIEGTCVCDDGYGGDNCDFKLSQKFVGEWSGPFACGIQTQDVIINIQDFPNDTRKLNINTIGLGIEFNGLTFGLDDKILVGMINDGYNSFTIDTQSIKIEIPNTPGISADVFGEGFLQSENALYLSINIKNDDFGASFECSGTGIK